MKTIIHINKKQAVFTRKTGNALYISFSLDLDALRRIKEMPKRIYHSQWLEWEIPMKDLGLFMMLFRSFPMTTESPEETKDVVNKIKEYKKGIAGFDVSQINENFKYITKPFPHQHEAFIYAQNHEMFLLADDQGCISGDAVVQINFGRASQKVSLRKAYELFKKHNRKPPYMCRCLKNNIFGQHGVKNILYKGEQQTYKLTLTNGYQIKATGDHLILTDGGYIELTSLKVNDNIVTNGTSVCKLCGSHENLITYKYAKYLGHCKKCAYQLRDLDRHPKEHKRMDADGYVVLSGSDYWEHPRRNASGYVYEHIIIMENHVGRQITNQEVVHHKNRDRSDNRVENLELLSMSEHRQRHVPDSINNLMGRNYKSKSGLDIIVVPKYEKVISVEKDIIQDVYDIVMDEPYHNFVANGIVVHNCGKTKCAIDIAVSRRGQFKHCLIICGVNGLKWNWEKEIELHSNESCHILGTYKGKGNVTRQGVSTKKIESLNTERDDFFLITNKESLNNKEILAILEDKCKSGEIGMVIIDEFHKVKNYRSQVGKNIHKLSSFYKMALTGTPLMNSPVDLYNLLRWVGVENRSLTNFENRYCMFASGFMAREVVGFRNMPELQERLHRVQLRRKKEDVLDLPPKILSVSYVELDKGQQTLYDDIKLELISQINEIKLLPNPLAKLIRLRQVTGAPSILDPELGYGVKLERLLELAQELKGQGSKFIVFSNWKQVIRRVEEMFRSYGITFTTIDGDVKDTDKMANIDSFQNDPNVTGLLGTTGALGTGFTAHAAEYVFFLDSPWNEANKRQAEDRAHRIGTKHTVNVVTIIAKDTIDERIEDLIYRKKEMSDFLVDGKGKSDWNEILTSLLE